MTEVVTMILTPTEETKHGRTLYKVSGVGAPNWWPHDGDLITFNDAHDIVARKGWFMELRHNDKG